VRKNPTFAAFALGALLVASCGVSREPTASGSGPAAATIEFADGSSEVVYRSDLDDLIDTTTANDDFVALVYQGSVPAGFEAVVLSQAVIGEVLENELEQAGAEPTDEDVEMARSLLLQDLEQMTLASPNPSVDPEQYFEDVSYLPFIVNLQAQQLALSSALAADAPEGAGDPCVRHILLEDEAAADEVVAALEGGADFATLAMERSTGPTGPDGGDLGCAAATNYVPEFGEAVLSAEVGEFVGPVETQFGFHVIIVEGYEVNGDVLVDAALASGLAEIDVTVDEEIGVWDTDQRIVVPAQPTP
jgi:hypothetical protein